MKRDLLVNENKLKPPYTNTNAYTNILKDDISYWNGTEFVKNYELSEIKDGLTVNH